MMLDSPNFDGLPPSIQLSMKHERQEQGRRDQRQQQEGQLDGFVEDIAAAGHAESAASSSGPERDGEDPAQNSSAARPKQQPPPSNAGAPDVNSLTAFPALGSGSSPSAPQSTWSAGSMASKIRQAPEVGTVGDRLRRIGTLDNSPAAVNPRPNTSRSSGSARFSIGGTITETFELPAAQQAPIKERERKTIGEVTAYAQQKTRTQINTSTSRNGNLTFLVKGKPEDVAKARRELWSQISKKITVGFEIPSSARGVIIGAKGKTLHSIMEASGTSISIPKKTEGEHEVTEDVDEFEAPNLVEIKIMGDAEGVEVAKQEIRRIVGDKMSKVKVRIPHIPPTYFPFISGPHGKNVQRMEEETGTRIHIPPPSVTVEMDGESTARSGNAILVAGEKDQVQKVASEIEAIYEELQRTCRELVVQIPKRQHKFIVGPNGAHLHELLETTGCAVELAPPSEASEAVTIRGPSDQHVKALAAVMEKANSTQVESLDFASVHHKAPNSLEYARQVLRYALHKQKLRKIESEHGVQIMVPRGAQLERGVVVEFVCKDRAPVENARKEVLTMLKALPPHRFLKIEVPSHLHRHIIGRKGQNLAKLREQYPVDIILSDERDEDDEVLLVYEGNEEAPDADGPAARKKIKECFELLKTEFEKTAAEFADYTTKVLTVPSKYHRYLIGPKGATLAAILGEAEHTVTVKIGSSKKHDAAAATLPPRSEDLSPDNIVVKGPSKEVDRVVAQIEKITEEAKHNEAMNSFSVEFKLPALVLSHVIGKGGANVNKLKEELNVRIDFDGGPKATSGAAGAAGKLSKTTTCTIVGHKKAVETAKQRITDLAKRVADETTVKLHIPQQHHRSLIGASGRYVLRLQEKYGVYIHFPRTTNRDADDAAEGDENEDADTVVIRGGKKGVQAAKQELLELMEYEQEHSYVSEFSIPARYLPHVVGRSGAKVKEIKDEFNVRLDLGHPEEGAGGDAPVSVRIEGSKSDISKAKSTILAITKDKESTVERTIRVDPKYHRYLIGPAGSRIRDIVSRCVTAVDASPDTSISASVRFPRAGSDTDQVTIKGDPAVVQQVIEEINKLVADQANQVAVTTSVPVADLPAIIGAGGSNLREVQSKHNVEIHVQKYRGNRHKGASDADATVTVNITGLSANCESAKEDLLLKCRVTRSLPVPKKYHRVLVGTGGQMLRRLRAALNVTVDYSSGQASSSVLDTGKRIDDEGEKVENDEDNGEVVWLLRGESANLDKACDIIAEELEQLKSRKTERIEIPRRLHRLIVGRGGRQVNEIRDQSGCHVHVPSADKASDFIMLTGSEGAIKAAKRMITDIVERGNDERR